MARFFAYLIRACAARQLDQGINSGSIVVACARGTAGVASTTARRAKSRNMSELIATIRERAKVTPKGACQDLWASDTAVTIALTHRLGPFGPIRAKVLELTKASGIANIRNAGDRPK